MPITQVRKLKKKHSENSTFLNYGTEAKSLLTESCNTVTEQTLVKRRPVCEGF